MADPIEHKFVETYAKMTLTGQELEALLLTKVSYLKHGPVIHPVKCFRGIKKT